MMGTKLIKVKNEEGRVVKEVSVPESITSLRFNSKELPEIKLWKVNGRYRLQVDVIQTETRKPDQFEIENGELTPDDLIARFDVTSVKSVPIEESTEKDSIQGDFV